MSPDLLLTRRLSVQVPVSYWFCLGGSWRRLADPVWPAVRVGVGGGKAEHLLPQAVVLRGQLLPLPPHAAQLLGESVQPLPQLPDLVPRSVPLGTDLKPERALSGKSSQDAGCSRTGLTLLHFSLQLAVQSDHHLMVFSICAARARASSSSRSLSSSLLSQSAPAPSLMAPREPSPKLPRPGDSSRGGLELGVSPVGLGVWARLSGERTPRSEPETRPRLHRRPPPATFPPSGRWGLGVWFMTAVGVWLQESIVLFGR